MQVGDAIQCTAKVTIFAKKRVLSLLCFRRAPAMGSAFVAHAVVLRLAL